MNQPHVLIVGGGIAGIFAALYSKTQYPHIRVTLLEQADQLGGLLASKRYGGIEFDYGTHVPRTTLIPQIDSLLFANLKDEHWRQFQDINAGNVSLDQYLYPFSGNPFLATPSNDGLSAQLNHIQTPRIEQPHWSSLHTQLNEQFGGDLVSRFFAPCLRKKLGVELTELAADSHRLIGLSRVILGDSDLMSTLKDEPRLDALLAFAKQTQGMSKAINFYPKINRGMGYWVELLHKQAISLGVAIKLQTTVKQFKLSDGGISHVELSGHHIEPVDHVCWTSPSALLFKACGRNPQSKFKPTIRSTRLFHFTFAQPFLSDNNYIDVNDPQCDAFRVTLYPNLRQIHQAPYACTVEVIINEFTQHCSWQSIASELVSMGIIDADNTIIMHVEDEIKAGFPIMSPEFFKESLAMATRAQAAFKNITLLGKASGRVFFMQDVLIDCVAQLDQALAGYQLANVQSNQLTKK